MVSEEKEEEPVKICRFCRFWSEELKGYCRREEEAVGQFFTCELWEAKPPDSQEGKKDLTPAQG